MSARWPALLVLALASCFPRGARIPSGDTEPVDTGPPFEPTAGTWAYAQTGVVTDSCGLAEAVDVPGTVEFGVTSDGTFAVDDGLTPPFTCTLDGLLFACPDRFPPTIEIEGTTLAIEGEAHGIFDSVDEAHGTQTASLDCTDAQCEADAAALGMVPPCDLAVSFTLAVAP